MSKTSKSHRKNIVKRAESRSRLTWPAAVVALLGKVPDVVVAKKMKCLSRTVMVERRRKGIEPFRKRRPNIKWTEDMVSLLGTDTDAAVAEELGICLCSVSRKRAILGVSAANPDRKRHTSAFPWRRAHLARLGTVPDRVIASDLGLSTTTVVNKRLSLQIAPYCPQPSIDWTDEVISLLGKLNDAELAQRFGMSADSVVQKRQALGIAACNESRPIEDTPALRAALEKSNAQALEESGLPWQTIVYLRLRFGIDSPSKIRRGGRLWTRKVIGLLGKQHDSWIAADLGVSPAVVRAKRKSLGIRAHISRRAWTEADIAILGTARDAVIALRLGRSAGSVTSMRVKHGIPRYRPAGYVASSRRSRS